MLIIRLLVIVGCSNVVLGAYPSTFEVGYGFVNHGHIGPHGHYLPAVARVKVQKDPFQSTYTLDEEGPTHYKYVRQSSAAEPIIHHAPLLHDPHHHHHHHGGHIGHAGVGIGYPGAIAGALVGHHGLGHHHGHGHHGGFVGGIGGGGHIPVAGPYTPGFAGGGHHYFGGYGGVGGIQHGGGFYDKSYAF